MSRYFAEFETETKVINVKRLKNSLSGNPKYEFNFNDVGLLTTPANAGWVYGFSTDTFLNKNDDLNYGFLWNIVKHRFQVSNEIIREISVATLDDLTRELEKVNKYKEKEEKIKFLGDLFMTILKDTPKIFSLKNLLIF